MSLSSQAIDRLRAFLKLGATDTAENVVSTAIARIQAHDQPVASVNKMPDPSRLAPPPRVPRRSTGEEAE